MLPSVSSAAHLRFYTQVWLCLPPYWLIVICHLLFHTAATSLLNYALSNILVFLKVQQLILVERGSLFSFSFFIVIMGIYFERNLGIPLLVWLRIYVIFQMEGWQKGRRLSLWLHPLLRIFCSISFMKFILWRPEAIIQAMYSARVANFNFTPLWCLIILTALFSGETFLLPSKAFLLPLRSWLIKLTISIPSQFFSFFEPFLMITLLSYQLIYCQW